VRGKGMSVLKSPARGDMFVEALVETPVKLTRRQEELLREFKAEGGGNHDASPESAGFFAKVKELWEDLKD
jgi:molecular chaperone DnaJ